jgi:hypothetical protein
VSGTGVTIDPFIGTTEMALPTTESPPEVSSSSDEQRAISTSNPPTGRSYLAAVINEVRRIVSTPIPPAASIDDDLTGECPAVYSQGVLKFLSGIRSFQCLKAFFGGQENFVGIVIALISVAAAYLYSGYAVSWNTVRLILWVRYQYNDCLVCSTKSLLLLLL